MSCKQYMFTFVLEVSLNPRYGVIISNTESFVTQYAVLNCVTDRPEFCMENRYCCLRFSKLLNLPQNLREDTLK